jgi:hypothetical protein
VTDRGLGDSAGAVAAAREPDGVEVGIVGHLDQRLQPSAVVAGEMPVGKEALRMEEELGLGMRLRRQRRHPLGDRGFDRRAWRHHSDPHPFAPLIFEMAAASQ